MTDLGEKLIVKDIDTLRRIRARCQRGDRKYTRLTRRLLLLVQYLDRINPDEALVQRLIESRIH